MTEQDIPLPEGGASRNWADCKALTSKWIVSGPLKWWEHLWGHWVGWGEPEDRPGEEPQLKEVDPIPCLSWSRCVGTPTSSFLASSPCSIFSTFREPFQTPMSWRCHKKKNIYRIQLGKPQADISNSDSSGNPSALGVY